MISQEAIQKILGIGEQVDVDPKDMARTLTITFFPEKGHIYSKKVKDFSDLLRQALIDLDVKVISYDESLETVAISKIAKRFFKILGNNILFALYEALRISHNYHYINLLALQNLLKRRRIKKGISVVALGEGKVYNLPIDYTSSFTRSSVITLLDRPADVDETSGFQKHFDTAMDSFSYHMTQIVILVDEKKWILYNFNASHPVYPIDSHFKENILHALVPKVAAPIRPHRMPDFIIDQKTFDPEAPEYATAVQDLIDGGMAFEGTNLYPKGKKMADLPFRNKFYRWIGSIHLDHRNGMSYGFLARQLPTELPALEPYSQAYASEGDYFIRDGHIYLKLDLAQGKFILQVPPIWVMTQRSGADKTHIDIHKDLLMLGLVDGKMRMRTPDGLKLTADYKPSFDTKVILAHAVGNAITAAIMNHFQSNAEYVKNVRENGLAIAHWHGYFHPQHIPKGWYHHGYGNPHVACSTPQSAIFALDGKLNTFEKAMKEGADYHGDIHIEPHHGTNIVFPSVKELGRLLMENPEASVLGNKYLGYYN
ncbi:MAG: hypothetical protein V4524_00725 [Patescibacteria group bacterium]